MSAITSVVVGGTGVTGSFIVKGLLKRGHIVTVIHSGRHKPSPDVAPWYHDVSTCSQINTKSNLFLFLL
jgi:nucleoside-diphosphate-sugar epimerase